MTTVTELYRSESPIFVRVVGTYLRGNTDTFVATVASLV